MDRYLVFTLEAPMASFGDLAGHENRGSRSWPARSAILGLVSAAFGIRRDDKAGLKTLDSLKTAVSVIHTGPHFSDFHTVQSIGSRNRYYPDTRREALSQTANVHTSITYRDYVGDSAFGVALWSDDPSITLEAVRDALLTPCFTLYLGRKSCPLSFPLSPKIIEAENPAEALHHADIPFWYAADGKTDSSGKGTAYYSDRYPSLPYQRIETRQDVPLDRQLWHFTIRDVFAGSMKKGE